MAQPDLNDPYASATVPSWKSFFYYSCGIRRKGTVGTETVRRLTLERRTLMVVRAGKKDALHPIGKTSLAMIRSTVRNGAAPACCVTATIQTLFLSTLGMALET